MPIGIEPPGDTLRAMDPALACSTLGDAPAAVEAHAALWAGPLTPLVIPLDCWDAPTRARLLLGRDEVPIAARVSAALDAGLEDAAWTEIARHVAQPLSAPRGLDTALALWVARESARLGLPATRAEVICAGGGDTAQPLADTGAGALRDVQALLPLPWPRWVGPVVLVPGADAFGGMPATEELLARPALPLLRLGAEATSRARGPLARGFCRLALALDGEPRAGWPAWLERGLAALAAARAEGQLVSPSRMDEVRRAAGPVAISAALAAPEPDEALALALCLPLMHPSERKHFGALLDLLRNGAGSEGALRVAYGLTPTSLCER